jgi:hypothetical protein
MQGSCADKCVAVVQNIFRARLAQRLSLTVDDIVIFILG